MSRHQLRGINRALILISVVLLLGGLLLAQWNVVRLHALLL